MNLPKIRKAMRAAVRPGGAEFLGMFFKTGPGEYAEGDRFIGIRMPDLRALVKLTDDLPEADVLALVRSEIHEERSLGLLTWVRRFERGDERVRRGIYRQYLAETAYINNWDLVDGSTPNIVGAWLLEHRVERKVLFKLVKSESLWERRIAMLATFPFIRAREFALTLEIAELLLGDKHDLIHKAVGWLLREVGKRDIEILRGFLKQHASVMPRTMLRYAIEKMEERERKRWMDMRKSS